MSASVKDRFVLAEEDDIVPGQGLDRPRRTDEEMDMAEVIRQRRGELGLSQVELAARIGIDKRQLRRYESGDTHPSLPAATEIAAALGITLDELAGRTVHRVDLTGDWWASWQTSKEGLEVTTHQQVQLNQRGDTLTVRTTTRGIAVEDGGYHWTGELRVWDNEILMGWYAAADGSIRSKGTMYFVLHPHGQQMSGRWVGLSYDGAIMTGWAAMAREDNAAPGIVEQLKESDRGQTRWDPDEATKPEHQPVVAAIVTSTHGVLIGRRNDGNPPWTFIAGEIEPGESASDAAIREVKEETGLLVRAAEREIGRRVHPKTGRTMIYLACSPVAKTDVFVGDEDELAEVRWTSLQEAEQLLPGLFGPVRLHLEREIGGSTDQGA